MLARDLMRTDMPTVTLDDTVAQVARLMVSGGYDEMPVLDEQGCFAGLITADDILRLGVPEYAEGLDLSFLPASFEFPAATAGDLAALSVRDLLRTDAHEVVTEEDPVAEVARILAQACVRLCPVVRKDESCRDRPVLLGVIDHHALLRLMVAPRGAEGLTC